MLILSLSLANSCFSNEHIKYDETVKIQFPLIKLIPLKYFIEITTNYYSQIDIFCLNQREQKILDSQTQAFLKMMYNLEDIHFDRDIVKFSLTYFSENIFNDDMTFIIRSLFKVHPILYIYEKLGIFHSLKINYNVSKFSKIFSKIGALKTSYRLL